MEKTELLKWLGQTFVTLAGAGFFFKLLTARADSRKINAGASLDESSVTTSLNASADKRIKDVIRENDRTRRRLERCENYVELLRQHIAEQDQEIIRRGGHVSPMPAWPPFDEGHPEDVDRA